MISHPEIQAVDQQHARVRDEHRGAQVGVAAADGQLVQLRDERGHRRQPPAEPRQERLEEEPAGVRLQGGAAGEHGGLGAGDGEAHGDAEQAVEQGAGGVGEEGAEGEAREEGVEAEGEAPAQERAEGAQEQHGEADGARLGGQREADGQGGGAEEEHGEVPQQRAERGGAVEGQEEDHE